MPKPMNLLRITLSIALFIGAAFAQTPKENLQRAIGTNDVRGTAASAPFKVETISALKAITAAQRFNGQQVEVANRSTANDGGSGTFYFDGSSSATDNGGTILAPTGGSGRWLRVYSGPVNVKWFGALGNGATDDSSAIQNAIAVATGTTSSPWTGNSNVVWLPPGVYAVASTLTIGTASGSSAGSANGLKIAGAGLGTNPTVSPGVVWLKWTGAVGGTIMKVRNASSITLEGINFNGNSLADVGLQIAHVTGDMNLHNMLVDSCCFIDAKLFNTLIGGTTASDCRSDIVNLTFNRCKWTPGSYATRTHVRGTSANALPVQFNACQWSGNRLVSYHFEVTGGMYSIHGGFSGGANVAAILYNVNPIDGVNQVPPNVETYGFNSQGDRSFIRWDYSTSRTSAAGLRPSVFSGLNYSTDGLTVDTDAIQWDGMQSDTLNLQGVFLNAGNLNIVSPTAKVFASGLVFPGGANNTVTGYKDVVMGQWYDGTVGVAKWNTQAGAGGVTLNQVPSTLGTPAANQVVAYTEYNNVTMQRELRAIFPSLRSALIQTDGVDPWLPVNNAVATGLFTSSGTTLFEGAVTHGDGTADVNFAILDALGHQALAYNFTAVSSNSGKLTYGGTSGGIGDVVVSNSVGSITILSPYDTTPGGVVVSGALKTAAPSTSTAKFVKFGAVSGANWTVTIDGVNYTITVSP